MLISSNKSISSKVLNYTNQSQTYPKLNKNYKNTYGYSLLEFTVSFLVSVPMLIATLDLTKVFQARSTAKAAVNTALRCLTVTDDPTCSSVSAPSAVAAYNIRVLTAAERETPLVSYDGEVKYISGPQYDVGPFRANILDQGFAEISGASELRGTADLYAQNVDVEYNEIANQIVPRILDGAGSTNRTPNFQAGYTELHFGASTRAANAQLLSGPGTVSDMTPENQASYSPVFKAPAIFSDTKCLNGKSYPTSSTGDFDCFATNSSGEKYVRAILHVKGIGRASSENVCGKAKLDLQIKEGSKWKTVEDLTGQAFRGSAGNFLPRGYNVSEDDLVDDQVIPLTYSSSQVHTEAFHGEIRFKLGRDYRVAVRTQVDTRLSDWDSSSLPCDYGSVSYEISGGTVYFPKIRKVAETIPCAEKTDGCNKSTQCTEPQTPQFGNSRLPENLFAAIQTSSPKIGVKSGDSIEKSCDQLVYSDQHFSEILADSSRSSSGTCSCLNYKLQRGAVSAPIQIGPINCSDTNKGVSDGVIEGSFLKNSNKAQEICPIVKDIKIDDSQISRRWSLKEKTLATSILQPALDCSRLQVQDVTEDAWRSNFSDYLMPIKSGTSANPTAQKSRIQTGRESTDFPTQDPFDPDKIKQKDARYQCESFSTLTVNVSDLEKKPNNNQLNIFENNEPVANCFGGEDRNIWKNSLALHLREKYLNVDNAFFVPKYKSAGLSIKRNCSAGPVSPEIAILANCTPYSALTSESTSKLLENESDCVNMPAECSDPCNSCQCELKRFNGSLTPSIDLQEAKALEKGREELRTFSPWLGRDCGETDCANLAFENNGTRAKGTATIRIPLFTKSLVNSIFGDSFFDGKDHFELHYSSEQSYERELAKS